MIFTHLLDNYKCRLRSKSITYKPAEYNPARPRKNLNRGAAAAKVK